MQDSKCYIEWNFFIKRGSIMIHGKYIKTVSFKIGSRKVTSGEAKIIMDKRIYKITNDKGEINERNDSSLCNTITDI